MNTYRIISRDTEECIFHGEAEGPCQAVEQTIKKRHPSCAPGKWLFDRVAVECLDTSEIFEFIAGTCSEVKTNIRWIRPKGG